jgi:serine O-acetyltransferase
MRKTNIGGGWWSQNVKILLQPGTLAVLNYRFHRWTLGVSAPVAAQLLRIIAALVRVPVELLTGVFISRRADIGPGLSVHSPYGVFVGPVKIGKNCVVQHGVLISHTTRRIGDNVYFGPGAKVVGKSTIGNNVVVVANSVVVADVPDDVIVVGVPARISFPRGHRLSFDKDHGAENGARAGRQPAPAVE